MIAAMKKMSSMNGNGSTLELLTPERARQYLASAPNGHKDMRLVMNLTDDIRSARWKNERHVVRFNEDGTLRSGREILMAVDRAGVPSSVYFETAYEDEEDEDVSVIEVSASREAGAIVDDPGEFMKIDKSMLSVDPSYQRPTAVYAAKRIARKFSWAAFGVLLVARRPDGTLFVYDGGHRLLAANMIDDINQLPCMVYDMAEVRQEAQAFVATNDERRRMSPHALFIADCEKGDANALFLRDLFARDGYAVDTGSGRCVRCVTLMRNLVAQDREVLEKLWPLFVELHDGSFINEGVVSTLFYLEKNSACETLLDKRWRERVVAMGVDGILKAARDARDYHKTNGIKVAAGGVLVALNRRAQRRFEVK